MGGAVARHPAVFELVGVAGAGKTTVFNALAMSNGLRCVPGVWHLPRSRLFDGAIHTLGSCLTCGAAREWCRGRKPSSSFDWKHCFDCCRGFQPGSEAQ